MSLLEGVTPHFFTCPTSFVRCSLQIRPQFYFFGCHPLEGVTRDGPLPPIEATVHSRLRSNSYSLNCHESAMVVFHKLSQNMNMQNMISILAD